MQGQVEEVHQRSTLNEGEPPKSKESLLDQYDPIRFDSKLL